MGIHPQNRWRAWNFFRQLCHRNRTKSIQFLETEHQDLYEVVRLQLLLVWTKLHLRVVLNCFHIFFNYKFNIENLTIFSKDLIFWRGLGIRNIVMGYHDVHEKESKFLKIYVRWSHGGYLIDFLRFFWRVGLPKYVSQNM